MQTETQLELFALSPENRAEELLLLSVAAVAGGSTTEWIDKTLVELRHLLVDSGICCIELKLVLEKVKEDFEKNLRAVRADPVEALTFEDLDPKVKYQRLAPKYLEQLFDPEINEELIAVWVEKMVSGEYPLPGMLPSILGQTIAKRDKEWADIYLDPRIPGGDMCNTPTLRQEVFERVGLI